VKLAAKGLLLIGLAATLPPSAYGDPWSDVWETVTATDEVGTLGEQLVHDFYPATEPTGTVNLLPKLDPTKPGPDRLVKLPNGKVHIHEIKTLRYGWPGKSSLSKTVKLNGIEVDVQQLDDKWIDAWAQRVRASGSVATPEELNAVSEVLQARDEGRLVRIFDEIYGVEGKYRSSFVKPAADGSLAFEEKMGPLSMKRSLDKLANYRQRFADVRNKQSLKNAGFSEPRAIEIPEQSLRAKGLTAYEDVKEVTSLKGRRVVPGLLAADGTLWVGLQAGAIEGGLVFATEAGIAGYRYVRGDTLRADFLTEVSDAAIKGAAVGSTTAVAVVLAPAGPAGWIVAGVGIGTYMFVDTSLKTWHEYTNRKYVSLDDLKAFGVDMDSVFAQGGQLLPDSGPLVPTKPLLPTRSVLQPLGK
jgi:hypothetical protein